MIHVFNDLLFESPEAQQYFIARTADMDPAEVEKLRQVLGKPSQFVGRVMSFDQAVAHWKAWHEWYATEGKELEAAQAKALGKSPPRLDKAQREAEIEVRREEWRKAVAQAKDLEQQWNEWERAEVAKIKEMADKSRTAIRKYVREKREAWHDLRDEL